MATPTERHERLFSANHDVFSRGDLSKRETKEVASMKSSFVGNSANSANSTRTWQFMPKKEIGNTPRYVGHNPQKALVPNLALSPTSVLLTELLGSEINTTARFSNIQGIREQWTMSSSSVSIPHRKTEDPDKAKLKNKLKKAAFPAIMARQKARRKALSMSQKKEETVEMDANDQKRIYLMRKEKEQRRNKMILTMNTSNFNLFKPAGPVSKRTDNKNIDEL